MNSSLSSGDSFCSGIKMHSSPEAPPDSPISLSRFNLRPIPPRVQKVYFFGKIRAFNTFTQLEWAYLTVSLIALTACLGINIQRLIVEDPNDSDFTFAILLLVSIVFCYHYVVHSLFVESWDELIVFVMSNVIVWVYCITNYVNHKDGENQPTIKLARLILVSVLSPFLIIVGIFQSCQYCKSNNLLFNTVGGISSLQHACRLFHICQSMLKFDLHLQLSMLILVMGRGVVDMSLTQKVVLASGVPVTILFIILGYLGLRFESILTMVVFYILGLLEPIYIIYKIYYTISYEDTNDATFDATFACGFFAFVIWILLMMSTLYFMKNYFGKGLKEKMFGVELSSEPAVAEAAIESAPSQAQQTS